MTLADFVIINFLGLSPMLFTNKRFVSSIVVRGLILLFVLVVISSASYEMLFSGSINLFLLENNLKYENLEKALYGFIAFIYGLLIGGMSDSALHSDQKAGDTSRAFTAQAKLLQNNLFKPKSSLIIGFCLIIFGSLSLLYAYKLELFLRAEYIPYRLAGNPLVPLSRYFLMLAAFMLGIASKKYLALSIFLALVGAITLLGTGSRSVGLFFCAFFLTLAFSSPMFKGLLMRVVLGCAGLYVSVISITLRESTVHGFIPYLGIFFSFSGAGDVGERILFMVYYTLVMPSYAAAVTFETGYDFISQVMTTSLNPLPGFLTNWGEYAPSMRLNVFAPFTFFGEALVLGNTFLGTFSALTAVLVSSAQRQLVNTKNGALQRYGYLVAILFFLFFFIFSLQYNMRSAMRFWYYGALLYGICFAWGMVSAVKRQGNGRI